MSDKKDQTQIESFRPIDPHPTIRAQRPIDKPKPPPKPIKIGGGPVIVPPRPPRDGNKTD